MNIPDISDVVLFHKILFPSELKEIKDTRLFPLFVIGGEQVYLKAIGDGIILRFYLSKKSNKSLGFVSTMYCGEKNSNGFYCFGFIIKGDIYFVGRDFFKDYFKVLDPWTLTTEKSPNNLHKICKRIVNHYWKPKKVFSVHPNDDHTKVFWTKESNPLLCCDVRNQSMKLLNMNVGTISIMQRSQDWIYTMVSHYNNNYIQRIKLNGEVESIPFKPPKRVRYVFRLYFYIRQIQKDLKEDPRATEIVNQCVINPHSLGVSQKERLSELHSLLTNAVALATGARFPFELTLEIFKHIVVEYHSDGKKTWTWSK